MALRIALAGNPNCGKTTLFNALTGSNQFVGNWPGVTVEKKEGKLKKHDDVIITDLPGIYSLSPYTLEEVVARNYLIGERPDAILNIIDGTNLERNLYLTTQLTELGIPVVIAINMMDVVKKNGDKINISELSKKLGCKIVEISALKGTGITEAAEAAIDAAKNVKTIPQHTFSGPVEHALAHIEEAVVHDMPEEQQRWYAIKVFERDDKVLESLGLSEDKFKHIEQDIAAAEKELDDDAESIITNERYEYIASIIKSSYKKKDAKALSVSDKIDKVVTNRWLGLPIFAIIMIIVYYVSVTTVGTWVTDWTNDGLFGDGFHLFGMSGDYDDETDKWANEFVFTDGVKAVVDEAAADSDIKGADELQGAIEDGDFGAFEEAYGSYVDEFYKNEETGGKVYDIDAALGEALDEEGEFTAPDPADYGTWVPGVPVLVEKGLDAIHCGDWLKSLILDGIVAGVGAVLGFVPQMLVLFIFLAILESCGYMARVAFIMDKIFRRFGLSGKSFIPILIGTGCGVPGIMASRTIENERDRRMTIMTTTFIPCGAKLPIISMIAVALFGGAWWVGPSAYFLGMAAIIISGIMLKKTKMFAGDPAPFVMELPAYHVPTVSNVLRSMWERGWSFIKKAGTIILLSSIVIWAGSVHGWPEGGAFAFDPDMELADSILGHIGDAVKWIFAPLGFDDAAATVATVMGLVAKEEVVGVFGVLDFEGLSKLAGYSFLAFNLLCAPCFAAIGAMKREMNSPKWTLFAVGYQCVFAYAVSLIIYQLGCLFTGNVHVIGLIFAIALIAFMIYMLVRPYKEATKLEKKVRVSKSKA
ncbi:ferrous iron transporter B [Ruminococcus flavefaciens]|uniref:Fe(2+) transporter FeoB n=1 Tax=Ruminococcus flavefaciens TaxID=1265 RepID=A0A315YQU8_RUMFL|nr:ferrous iron transporter B [Ruminococcus flavefaciens]PWJ14558.1 ferrous iron transport protein B [Ruminococcus flavefaciens]SSA42588.1 ferrous iron transport protein B [Ruminococcus flavefaciens]